jgi:hypothetical protein
MLSKIPYFVYLVPYRNYRILVARVYLIGGPSILMFNADRILPLGIEYAATLGRKLPRVQ